MAAALHPANGSRRRWTGIAEPGPHRQGDPRRAAWEVHRCAWSDAYVYNTLEAICLALAVEPDGDAELAQAQAALRAKVEEWIPIILAAQLPDGYIHSFHTVNGHPHFSNIGWHEFYVMGYFLEMGVAHYRITGGKDRRLYEAAVRCADHLENTFGPPPKRTWKNGHPGLELALCRLARLVNEVEGAGAGDKYSQLAKHFLDHQHEIQPNPYDQSNMPAVELTDAEGHAVRATYFYTAMTDMALLMGDEAYHNAVDKIWANAIHRKHYLTGGVGASHRGEAFSQDFDLRNDGYCESCAGCGLSFWSDRMHRLHQDAHYRDVQERVLYNNLLGSVELSGQNFFYQNPLASDKPRYPWHGCPCCVGNIPRALIAIKDLMYSTNAARDTLYLSHFVDSAGHHSESRRRVAGHSPGNGISVEGRGAGHAAAVRRGRIHTENPDPQPDRKRAVHRRARRGRQVCGVRQRPAAILARGEGIRQHPAHVESGRHGRAILAAGSAAGPL